MTDDWTVERKVSVATLMLVVAQIVGGVWWLATLQADVTANTSWRTQNAEAVVRMDERSSRMATDIDRMSQKLEELLRTARTALTEQRLPSYGQPQR